MVGSLLIRKLLSNCRKLIEVSLVALGASEHYDPTDMSWLRISSSRLFLSELMPYFHVKGTIVKPSYIDRT